ncbi:MAG: hypothetical protein AAGK78_03305, partial [Planctomycetota bacterium]
YVLRNVAPGQPFDLRLRSEGGDTVGAWSEVVSVETAERQPLTQTELGNAGGNVTVLSEGRHYDVRTGGRDIWDFEDEGTFVGQTVTGDFDFAVRLIDLAGGDDERMAGLMARSSLDASSANVFIKARPGDLRLTHRATDFGQTVADGDRPAADKNQWLRLQRIGDVFVGYASTDGLRWSEVSRVQVRLGGDVHLGLAASAHSETESVTARFRDLTNLAATRDVPAAPEDLVAVSTASGVGLMWADTSGGTVRFVVQRQRVGGVWQTLGFNDAGSFTFEDATPVAGEAYRYRVAAVGSAGTSASIESDAVRV